MQLQRRRGREWSERTSDRRLISKLPSSVMWRSVPASIVRVGCVRLVMVLLCMLVVAA